MGGLDEPNDEVSHDDAIIEWLRWHDPEALSVVTGPRRRRRHAPVVPLFHDPRYADRETYGFFSDHEWALTKWPNRRYL